MVIFNIRIVDRLPRPCIKCNEKFKPTGPVCKICDKCIKKANLIRYSKAKGARVKLH